MPFVTAAEKRQRFFIVCLNDGNVKWQYEKTKFNQLRLFFFLSFFFHNIVKSFRRNNWHSNWTYCQLDSHARLTPLRAHNSHQFRCAILNWIEFGCEKIERTMRENRIVPFDNFSAIKFPLGHTSIATKRHHRHILWIENWFRSFYHFVGRRFSLRNAQQSTQRIELTEEWKTSAACVCRIRIRSKMAHHFPFVFVYRA